MTSEKYWKILLNEWKFHLEINIFIKKFSIFKYATGLKFEKFKKGLENFRGLNVRTIWNLKGLKFNRNLEFERFNIRSDWKLKYF